jgi:hypothetical protein
LLAIQDEVTTYRQVGKNDFREFCRNKFGHTDHGETEISADRRRDGNFGTGVFTYITLMMTMNQLLVVSQT